MRLGSLIIRFGIGLIVIILAVGCRNSGQSSSGQPVVYPPGWPIQEFKAPAGSFRAELKVSRNSYSDWTVQYTEADCVRFSTSNTKNKHWGVGFHYPGKWSDAVSEIEKNLSGYTLKLDDQGSVNDGPNRNNVRHYTLTGKGHDLNLAVFNWNQHNRHYWELTITEPGWPE